MTAESIDLLRHDLSPHLEIQGWVACQQVVRGTYRADAGEIETYQWPLREGFDAVAMFAWTSSGDAEQIIAVGGLGVKYGPAHALLEHLIGSEIFCVMLNEPNVVVKMRDATSVSEVADELAGFVSDHVAQLDGLTDVDRIIDLIRQQRAQPFAARMAGSYAMDAVAPESGRSKFADAAVDKVELIAALLAGAGRYADARQALTETVRELPQDDVPYDHHRFMRQLTRIINAEGRMSLPQTPPRWPPRPGVPERLLSPMEMLKQALPEGRARQEAIEAVREVSSGRTRDELRAMYEHELSSRGLSIDIDGVEPTIDLIATEHEPLGKVRIAARGARAAVELMASWREQPAKRSASGPTTEQLRSGSAVESEPPLPVRPDRAAYPIDSHSSRKRAYVELDPTAYAILEHLSSHGTVQAWFTWDADSSPAATRVSVHIGSSRIGWLAADVAECLRPAMEAAAERDEDPWTYAQLAATFGAAPYVLTVGLPCTSGESDADDKSYRAAHK
jgi:hypothetical protein